MRAVHFCTISGDVLAAVIWLHGGHTEKRPGLHSYEIATSLDGKPATKIRMIVYASGCEIQTLVVPLADDAKSSRSSNANPSPVLRFQDKSCRAS